MKFKKAVSFCLAGISLGILPSFIVAGSSGNSIEEVIKPVVISGEMHEHYHLTSEKLVLLAQGKNMEALFDFESSLTTLLALWADNRSNDVDLKYWRKTILELQCTALMVARLLSADLMSGEEEPDLNIMPPVASSLMFSGMSPDAIPNEDLQQEYREAIEANAEKAENFRLKSQLQKQEKIWKGRLMRFISTNYVVSDEADVQDVKSSLSRCMQNTDLRNFILSTLNIQ